MLLLKLVLALGAVGALFALLPLKAPEAPAIPEQSLPQEKTEDGLAKNEVPGLKSDLEADRSIEADPIEEPGLGGDPIKEEISSLPPDVSTVHETSIEAVAPSTKQQKPQKLKTQQTSKPKENADKGSKPKTDMDKASKPKADVVDKAAKPTLSEEIHVCFCSDDTDWRPLAAAINSTLQNAKRPQLVTFHLITSPDLAPVVSSVLVKVLPALATQLKVHSSTTLQSRIKSLISYRKSSGARKGLASPFNFAPFYLEDFISESGELPQRLIYLDTDVLLLDDIGALWKTDMKGLPAAAVEDCSQSFELYIDFAEMEELGLKSGSLSPKECVFNRGIFMMDVTQWKRLHITQDIEHWMGKYRESKKDIYKFGMSQPPWLLALHKKYHKLGSEWNCRGLGRDTLSLKELKELKYTLSLDFKALQKVGARAMGEQATPYIASCSREAMLLHFNGKLKPWRSRRWVRKQPSPMCLVKATTFPTLQRKNVNGMDFVRCADIWSNFLSPESVEVLNATAVQFYQNFKQ